MRIGLVFGVVGLILRPFALAFVPPMLIALRDGMFDAEWNLAWNQSELHEAIRFAITGLTTFVVGTVLARFFRRNTSFRRAEALLVVTMTWVVIGGVAAVPYLLNGFAPEDAYFESISGLTTTGATILAGDMWEQSRAFFLWRAMTQWFGGLGVIALFVVVLPRLGIAGRQIFFAESSSAPSESVVPSVRRSASKLWIFYTGLTLLMAAILTWTFRDSTHGDGGAELGVYDAVIHSLTTLCAGGFSNNDSSIMGITNSASSEWVFTAFMFLAGASYPLMLVAATRSPLALLRDGEFRLYTLVTVVATAAITLMLFFGQHDVRPFPERVPDHDLLDSLRLAAFQVASLISSAGFASDDFEFWGPMAKAALVMVMILGGCAGSAAGGAKEVRFLLVFKFIRREFIRALHPRAVIPIRYGGEAVSDRVMRAIFLLVLLYGLGYGVFAVPVIVLSPDVSLEEGFSAAIACLSNVGPAFGQAGPMGTYQEFSAISKVVLTFAMLIGRLEIVTVLALCQFRAWNGLTLRLPKR